jgi:hypothetical protein
VAAIDEVEVLVYERQRLAVDVDGVYRLALQRRPFPPVYELRCGWERYGPWANFDMRDMPSTLDATYSRIAS